MNCKNCGLILPERYVERAQKERDALRCPNCYTVVEDYRKDEEEGFVGAVEYDGETTITLDDNAAALVVTPEEYKVYLPKMDEDDEVPVYIVLMAGISMLMADDDFVGRVLERAFAELGDE